MDFKSLVCAILMIVLYGMVSGADELREWQSRSGASVHARVARVTRDRIILRKQDGSLLEIDYHSLSDKDQEFLADLDTRKQKETAQQALIQHSRDLERKWSGNDSHSIKLRNMLGGFEKEQDKLLDSAQTLDGELARRNSDTDAELRLYAIFQEMQDDYAWQRITSRDVNRHTQALTDLKAYMSRAKALVKERNIVLEGFREQEHAEWALANPEKARKMKENVNKRDTLEYQDARESLNIRISRAVADEKDPWKRDAMIRYYRAQNAQDLDEIREEGNPTPYYLKGFLGENGEDDPNKKYMMVPGRGGIFEKIEVMGE